MTNNETGAALAGHLRPHGNPARREAGRRQQRDRSHRDGNGGAEPRDIGYERWRADPHICQKRHLSGRHFLFRGVNEREARRSWRPNRLRRHAQCVLATQTGRNNVFFATESMLADSNMLQHAIGWAARPQDSPYSSCRWVARHPSSPRATTWISRKKRKMSVATSAAGIYDKLLRNPRAVENGFQFRRLLLRQYRE